MSLEIFGYVCLGIVALVWLAVVVVGVIAAFPYGLVGALALIGVAALFAKVVRERRASAEDDYYAKHVER